MMPPTSTHRATAVALTMWLLLAVFTVDHAFADEKTYKAKDYAVEITAPDSMTPDKELNDSADISISDRSQEAYCIVLVESQKDYPDDYTLEEYAKTVIPPLAEGLDKAKQVKTSVKEVNGYEVIQYELSGVFKEERIKVVYLITCIKSPRYYSQMLCWTVPSKWEKLQKVYEKMVKSFKET